MFNYNMDKYMHNAKQTRFGEPDKIEEKGAEEDQN